MIQNFTISDIVRSLEASLLLALILFIPGYVIGWLSNVFDFRERRLATQTALSTPLAVAILPILIFLVGRYPKVLWILFGASWLGFAFLIRHMWKRRAQVPMRGVPRWVWAGGALALIWAVIVIGSLVDLQIKDRLYFSSTAYDYSTRTAFTAEAARAIPPINPFFSGNSSTPLRYHYFWMLVCSLPMRMGNVNSRQAMYAGTVWAGIALMSLIAIVMKFLLRVRERLERKVLIACSLLLVTGLDILPTAYFYLRWHLVFADMEWWNEQITSWVDALLWTPHHLMSVVACMIGLLVIREPATTTYRRALAILVAGVAFASAAGLSVLVSFTFALFAVLWLVYASLRKWWEDAVGLLAAGMVGLFVALPYLHSLMGPASDRLTGSSRFFSLEVRDFPLGVELAYSILHLPIEITIAPGVNDTLLLFLLPINYFLELGFFLIAGAIRLRSVRSGSIPLTREEETGWMIVATSFFVGSFLRSTTLGSNDLGWRCFFQAQLVLLLWGALLIDDWWSGWRFAARGKRLVAGFAGILAAIGLMGSMYQVIMLRAYPILVDQGSLGSQTAPWLEKDRQIGQRTYALRSVYDSLGAILPPAAIVQYNPYGGAFIPHQMYSGHGAAIGLPGCGATFGGATSDCEGREHFVRPLFKKPLLAESAALDSICREYGINIMLVDDLDTVWKQRDSWVWTRKPILANDHVRAFACGDVRR